MMNQKVGIYIILSVVLLYLYYKRGDLAIFAAFVAVVAGTLIFRVQTDDREGFGFGGGGGGGKLDKECAKMGFKPIKLDKDDLAGTLEHVIKATEPVAAKHWPYDGMGGNKGVDKEEDEKRKKKNAELNSFFEVWTKESKEVMGDNKKKSEQANMFISGSAGIYEKKRYNELVAEKPEDIEIIISGGEITLKVLEKVSKSDEIDSGFKKTLKYLICLTKYWISIYKELQKANGGGGGDDGGGGDEEEKPKKKKKTKKKASEDDADEEEKPKKKKKKASEDDEE